MSNPIAIAIVLLIGGMVVADLLFLGWDMHVFLGRKFIDLVEFLAFWR